MMHPKRIRSRRRARFPWAKGAIAALLATALCTLSACGSSTKREECRSLTTVINAGADRVEKAQSTVLDPAGLKGLSDSLEKSATEAEALKLTTPELQQHAKDYAALVRDVAKTARAMAAASESLDIDKAKAASAEMEKLTGNEPKLVSAVNKVCTGE